MRTLLLVFLITASAFAQGHNGTTVGTPTFAAAKFSNGLTATSDANYITLPTGTFAFLTSSSSWTIEAWVTMTGTPTLVFACGGSVGDSVSPWFGTQNGNFVIALGGTSGFSGAQTSSTSINNGSLHHVAAVMTSGTSLKLFVDGVQGGGTLSGTIPNPPISSGHTTGILGRFEAGGFAWNHTLDEVAMWNVAKYSTTFTPPSSAYVGNEANLVGLYHLQADGTDSSTGAVASPVRHRVTDQ